MCSVFKAGGAWVVGWGAMGCWQCGCGRALVGVHMFVNEAGVLLVVMTEKWNCSIVAVYVNGNLNNRMGRMEGWCSSAIVWYPYVEARVRSEKKMERRTILQVMCASPYHHCGWEHWPILEWNRLNGFEQCWRKLLHVWYCHLFLENHKLHFACTSMVQT